METIQNYASQMKAVRKSIDKNKMIWHTDTINSFTLMSAHLKHFMPGLSYDARYKVFKKFVHHQQMNSWDLKAFGEGYKLPVTGWKSFLKQVQARSGMICTFHFGAYQLINYLLLQARLPFALLVSGNVTETWKQRNDTLLDMIGEAENDKRFILLNANDRAAFRQLYKLAENGYYLLVYADGLEGANTQHADLGVQLPFLASDVQVPRGLAAIAHSLKLPVYPVLALRKKNDIQIKAWPTIYPDASTDRKNFSQALMASLYASLATYVLQKPEQWTNWPFLEIIRTDLKCKQNYKPKIPKGNIQNPKKYGIFVHDDRQLLMRKKDMQCFAISTQYYNDLRMQWYG